MDWQKLANQETIEKTKTALEENGIKVLIAESAEAAKAKVLELLPKKAEVMTMISTTLAETGIASAIDDSGEYDSVHKKLIHMDRATQGREMQRLGAAPEWAVGSVHAVTEDGKVLVASNTGSQLPAYLYGAAHVIWVVGTQKLVKTQEDAMKRIYEYILPKETIRARKAYGQGDDFHSNVSKIAIFNKELNPNRITMILVKEPLGF